MDQGVTVESMKLAARIFSVWRETIMHIDGWVYSNEESRMKSDTISS